MQKMITHETLRNLAYSNDRLIKVPLRGHCDLSAKARVHYRDIILRAFDR